MELFLGKGQIEKIVHGVSKNFRK